MSETFKYNSVVLCLKCGKGVWLYGDTEIALCGCPNRTFIDDLGAGLRYGGEDMSVVRLLTERRKKMIDLTLGEKIRILRLRKDVRQNELAEMAGITPPYLSQIELGKTTPGLQTFKRIANALGHPVKIELELGVWEEHKDEILNGRGAR